MIPVAFERGRVGDTLRVREGDYLVVWVKGITSKGRVLAEYADGVFVGHRPPLLPGEETQAAPRVGTEPAVPLNAAGVTPVLVSRRSRYPGSRVLRLGYPDGGHVYPLTICSDADGALTKEQAGKRTCNPDKVILNERIRVAPWSYFGLGMHLGYAFPGATELAAERTPAAIVAGDDVFQIQERENSAEFDVAVLLTFHPGGRDPGIGGFPLSPKHWRSTGVSFGFTARDLPWKRTYLGVSYPLADGLALSVLGSVAAREVPVGAKVGVLVESADLTKLFPTRTELDWQVNVGLTLDYSLGVRAFGKVWDVITSKGAVTANEE